MEPQPDRLATDRLADGGNRTNRTNKWAVLALVAMSSFMTTLDGSIVNIGLPSIAQSFGTPLGGTIEWIIIGYLLVIAAVLLTFGRLSDMVGRKPIWAAGLVVFTVGSGVCGAAPSLGALIAFRAVQGLGAALLFAPGIAMITDVFGPGERGRAIGLNSVAVSLGVTAGPTLGGLITEYFTWRWIFYLNVPIGVVGFVAALRLLQGTQRGGRQQFDPVGALLLALGIGSLVLGLSFGQEWGWTSARLLAVLAVGVVALVALVIVERRVPAPIIHLWLLRDRVFASALTSLVLNFLALFAVSFLLPFYFEELRGFSTQKSGLLLTPMSLTVAAIAPVSGSFADRIGSRWLAAGGLSLACVGLFLMSGLDTRSSELDVVWRLVVIGCGIGMFQSPNNRALMAAAPRSEQGEASGLLGTGRVVGQSLSVALAGAVFASLGGAVAGAQLLAGREGQPLSAEQIARLQGTFVGAFHAALLVCASLAAIGIFTALVRGSEPGRESRGGAESQVEPPRQAVLPVNVQSAPGGSGRSGKSDKSDE